MSGPASANRKRVIADLDACGRAFDVSLYVAFAFLVLGIVSDVMKVNLGLSPIHWLLLVVAALLAAIAFRIGWAVSWYLTIAK